MASVRPAPEPPFTVDGDGIFIAVRATPRAARSVISGVGVGADGRSLLLVRLAAPPVDGAANKALIVLIAGWLDVRRGDVAICAGATGRIKRVHVAGDPAVLGDRMTHAVARIP